MPGDPKKKTTALDLLWDDDPPAQQGGSFDALWGSEKPDRAGTDSTPVSTPVRPPEPKPAGRRVPEILTRDLAPVVRKTAARAKHAIGAKLDELLTGNAYQRNIIPREDGPVVQSPAMPLAHPLAPVTVEADPQKITRRVARLDPITQVMANTQAGIDKPAVGGELPFNEDTYQEYRRRLLEKYDASADDVSKKRYSRMLGQLEKQRSEAMALRKEDPISAAGRVASFGLLQTPERMAIRREQERDIAEGRAVTPEELGAEGIIHENERPHRVAPGETGAQAVAGLAGSLLPFEAGERAGMHVAAKIADAIEVGIPRARTIAQALRYAEAPLTATTEFGRGAQAISKGMIRGQAGGAFMGGVEATIHDEPVGETMKAGIVPFAMLGGLFGAAGAGMRLPGEAIDRQTGAYIANATEMIERTRPDQTPIGDKMPEAHGRAITDMIERLIGAKKAAMTPDERLQLAASQKKPPEGIEVQPAYTSRESRVQPEPDIPLRTQREITMEREGLEATPPIEQLTSEQLWERQRAGEPDLNTPAGQDALARRLVRGQRWTPEGIVPETRPDRLAAMEEQSLPDRFDMSKNLERVQEEQRLAQEQALVEEARVQAEAEKANRPKTFAQELMEAGKGDAVQRMKDSDLVAYARRVARHTDKVGKELQRKVWQEIKGRGLDKKVGPAALALAAVAGAAKTEDEGKRTALLGAAALSTHGVKLPFKPEEIAERYRRGASARTLRHEYGLTKAEIYQLLERHGVERRSEPKTGTPPRESPYSTGERITKSKRLGPAALGIAAVTGASQTEDENKRNLLLGAAVLATGRIHEGEIFHSRLTRAIEAFPKQWEQPRPAADWLGKLASGGGGNFSREEFNRVLRPFLEKAKEEKRKLTKQDIVEHTELNRIELNLDRTTPTGEDIVTPKPEEPPPPPAQPYRARELTVQNVRGAEPGDGPRVLEVRQARNDEVADAEERFREVDDEFDQARRELYNTSGISSRALDEALEKADNGDSIDVDKAMEWLYDEIDVEPPEGYDEPRISSHSRYNIEELDEGSDAFTPDRRFVVKYRDENTDMAAPTRLEALAAYAWHYGDEATGNLANLIGPRGRYEVREQPDGTFAIHQIRDPWGNRQEARGVVAEGPDRTELVEDFVRDNYEPPEDTARDDAYSSLRDALETYNRTKQRYNEVESETYSLREEPDEDDSDFMERLEQARAEDRRVFIEGLRERGLRDYDEEFYQLDEEDQQFIRDAQQRGAVGVLTPFWDEVDLPATERNLHGNNVEGAQGAQNVLVFDPAIPHYPFPREGRVVKSDPDQLSLLDQPVGTVTFPPRETTLKATGRSKFHTYQRTPGGQNYREIKVSWGNPQAGREALVPKPYTVRQLTNGNWQVVDPEDPINFRRDHWQGDPANTAVHGRLDEHIYTGEMGMHPALQKIADERAVLARELARIADEFGLLEAANGGEANATPEMHALAGRYREVSAKVNKLDDDYAAGVKSGYGPGTQKLVATNLMEAQSDWKQMGEAGGFFEPTVVSTKRRAELQQEGLDLSTRRDALDEQYSKDVEAWNETPDGKRYAELIDKYYNASSGLSPEEHRERTDLLDKKDDYVAKLEKAYDEQSAAIKTRRAEIKEELAGRRLLPGEKERLAANLAKARERLRVALEKRKNVSNADYLGVEREVSEAQSRVYRLENAMPVPDMPWKDPESAFGLASALLLKEAAHADSDLATWSHSTNRMALANLSKKAAEITYDNSVTNGVRRLLKSLGYDVKPEVITMDGHKHWMVRLSPAMKEAIKKSSFPLLAATALLAAPQESEAQGGEKKGMSAVPYLIAAGLVAGAFKTLKPEMRAKLAAKAKAGGWDSRRIIETRFHSNPIPQALKELKRAPTAAAVAALAGYAASSDNKDFANTSTPLFALAILNAIGSKNLGAAKDALGKVLVDNLRKTETGTKAVRFVNPDALLSPDVRAAILGFEAMKAKGAAKQVEYTGKLKKLGPIGDRIVSDFIEGEQFEDPEMVRAIKPDDLHAIALTAQDAAEEVVRGTEMQIESGALSPDAAIPHYLPGKYAYWEALDALTERAPRGQGVTVKPRISPIKRRTLAREDLAERNRLGEIRESSYRVGVAIEKAYANTAAATLFKTLRQIPGVIHPEFQSALDDFLVAKDLMRTAKANDNAADIATAEAMLDAAELKRRKISERFKLKGGDYVTLPDTKSMGVLRGAVVQRDVANSLNGIPEKRAVDKLLRFWKLSKTVFNPGTHAANIISNTTMAHMAGMRMTEQPLWLTKASRDMKAYGEATRALSEAGVLDVNAVTAGGEGTTARSARSETALAELAQTTRPETAKVLREVGIEDPKADPIPTFRKAGKELKDLYNNEDNIFRVAMYLKARAPKSKRITLDEGGGFGMTPEEAVTYARDSFGNFRTRSPLLRVLRGSVAPFILYPAKALPAFAKNVVDHPARYITLMAIWGALNEYSKAEVGEIPEEDIDERDRRKYGYFFPGLTQLPFVSKTGAHAATDLARWTPMSGATDVATPGAPVSTINPKFPRILQPSGPAADVYGKFVNNIDPFTHQPRYKADYPLKRNIGRALEDVIQLVAPSALGFHRERIMQDIDNRDMEALKTDLLGPTGLRPRYLRAGGNVMNAEIERQRSMQDAKAEARRSLSRSQSPDRDAEILKDYLEYVDQIEKNFQRRAAIKPGKE